MKPLQPGDPERVGKYQLVGRLGQGGMGRVFLGQSPGGRQVAVKLIRPELGGDREFRARFAREVAAARNVSGLFTAPVVDADPDAPEPWLVTAYVPGPSLAEAVERQGPLSASPVLALAAGLAEGLVAIHAAGVVHRDLKPSNVLLAADGPRIIDFGISRAVDSTALTGTGLVVGSPGFMSPEQALGREAGPPSDIFCLGAVLVFAATGQGPFGSGSSHTLLYRVVYGPPAVGEAPPEIRSLAARCLDKDPSRRPTAEQILSERGSVPATGQAQPAGPRSVQPGTVRPAAPPPGTRADQATPGSGGATAPTSPPPLPHAFGPQPLPHTAAGQQDPPHAAAPMQRPRRARTRRVAWLPALLPVAGAAALVVALWLPWRQPARSAPAGPARPRAVVAAYIAAINRHDWLEVWRLGGRNFGQSYPQMIAGYRGTTRDAVSSLYARGDLVTVRFLAYHADGTVQAYLGRYVVRNGVIRTGRALLLGPG